MEKEQNKQQRAQVDEIGTNLTTPRPSPRVAFPKEPSLDGHLGKYLEA